MCCPCRNSGSRRTFPQAFAGPSGVPFNSTQLGLTRNVTPLITSPLTSPATHAWNFGGRMAHLAMNEITRSVAMTAEAKATSSLAKYGFLKEQLESYLHPQATPGELRPTVKVGDKVRIAAP